jgi:hypothetical protein
LPFHSKKTCATPALPTFDEASTDDGSADSSDSAPAPEPRASATAAAASSAAYLSRRYLYSAARALA